MTSASITEVKNNLSKYLDLVKGGEPVLITERGIVIARLESVRTQTGETADQSRLARLERAGVIRRGRPVSGKLIHEAPPAPAGGASALEVLLEERRSGR